jgi:hypothetical protein
VMSPGVLQEDARHEHRWSEDDDVIAEGKIARSSTRMA